LINSYTHFSTSSVPLIFIFIFEEPVLLNIYLFENDPCRLWRHNRLMAKFEGKFC